jgi:hypothetical protein
MTHAYALLGRTFSKQQQTGGLPHDQWLGDNR